MKAEKTIGFSGIMLVAGIESVMRVATRPQPLQLRFSGDREINGRVDGEDSPEAGLV